MTPGISRTIQALKRLRGLDVEVSRVEAETQARRADALLEITSASGRSEYVLEARRTVTTTSLPAVLDRLEHLERAFGRTALLTSPYITPGVAERLLEAEIQFVDAAGNAYLDGPAAYVVILGQRPKEQQETATGGFTVTDLHLVFALLVKPDLASATYRQIRDVSGVSLGKISGTMKRLETSRYLRKLSRGKRVLLEPRALLERWEFGYLEQLRPSLRPTLWRLGPGARLDEVHTEALGLARNEALLIGGEYAADAYTGVLRPASLTLHVPPGRGREIARRLRLPPARGRADVTMLERFVPLREEDSLGEIDRAQDGDRRHLAHPVLVRAELLAQGDDRLLEVAARLSGAGIASDSEMHRGES